MAARGTPGLVPQNARERAIAVHWAKIVKNIDVEEILRARALDPSRDPLPPGPHRSPEFCVGRHHAALAIRHAHFVQDVAHVLPERGEPAVLGTIRLTMLEDEGVVLIEGEQAFAAP